MGSKGKFKHVNQGREGQKQTLTEIEKERQIKTDRERERE